MVTYPIGTISEQLACRRNISFLLEVVEALKDNSDAMAATETQLTEWAVYKLIVDLLMLRDLRRSSVLSPQERRSFLQDLSVILSERGSPVVTEQGFKSLIERCLSKHLRRFGGEERPQELERLFADLRSSATLTRAQGGDQAGWRFSHNSLREFLVAERLLAQLSQKGVPTESIPITDAMRTFVASKTEEEIHALVEKLRSLWGQRSVLKGIGRLLTLLWDGLVRYFGVGSQVARSCLVSVSGQPIALDHLILTRLVLSSEVAPADLSGMNCTDSELYDIDLTGAKLQRADFSRSLLESVSFSAADLTDCSMAKTLAMDIDVSGAILTNADFRAIKSDEISILVEDTEDPAARRRLEGEDALGYVRFHNAITDPLPDEVIFRHHPKFDIAKKVLEKLAEQNLRQRRGLEQRGAASKDVSFAKALVRHLSNEKLVVTPRARKDLLSVTELGHEQFSRFVETGRLPDVVVVFLRDYSK